jgi:hypothetical protein
MLKLTGVAEKIGPERIFPTIRAGWWPFGATRRALKSH